MAKTPIDNLDRRLLSALEVDGRLSHAELSRRLGISPPAIAERIARLIDTGVIIGFHAILDPAAFGLTQEAVVEFTPFGPDYEKSVALVKKFGEVRQAYRVTGTAFLILLVRVSSNAHLNELLLKIASLGHTKTSVVLEAEVENRQLIGTAV